MENKETILKNEDAIKHPDSGRRSFMWKAGAAVSALLATAVPVMSMTRISKDKGNKSEVNSLSSQLALLEDENEIRKLHQSYENYLNQGAYGKVVNLFTDNAEVIFSGGIFKGKNKGVNRLYNDNFSAGMTGKSMEQAPTFELNNEQQQDTLTISKNGKSAKALFNYSIQVGSPIISDSLLVKMARLQGEGVMKWWEAGVYKVSYVKDSKNGNWKIERLEYQTLSRADYKQGRAYANPISVPEFTKVFPDDPSGPDKLV